MGSKRAKKEATGNSEAVSVLPQHTPKSLGRSLQRGFVTKSLWEGFITPIPSPMLDAERQNIEKFIATWLPHYPNRFYEFGIYPTFFRKQRELAEQNGRLCESAYNLEADAAADVCRTV